MLVRIAGQPPLQATIYQLQKLRCHLCGQVFTAAAPAEAGSRKYDATAGSMIGLLKYGSGLPFNRLRRPAGESGDSAAGLDPVGHCPGVAADIAPAFEELIRQAAQGDVLHNDDTTVKILELMGKRARQEALAGHARGDQEQENGADQRTRPVHLGRRGHARRPAGRAVLQRPPACGREPGQECSSSAPTELPPPIQMCDALSRNLPGELQTILAHCLAHARRQFVDVYDRFPEECRYLLEALAVVYRNDALARRARAFARGASALSSGKQSGPTMEQLHDWLTRQFEREVDRAQLGPGRRHPLPAQALGEADAVLAQAGAPLDNNLCERALKKAILHRKNALFYKTSKRGPRRRPVHEPDLHLRTESGPIRSTT